MTTATRAAHCGRAAVAAWFTRHAKFSDSLPTGALPAGTLTPLPNTLQAKRIAAADLPLSTKPDSKNKRYRLADSYMRFWLAFLERFGVDLDRSTTPSLAGIVENVRTPWSAAVAEIAFYWIRRSFA
ncbi:hypothetical protein OG563_38035 [Nocardia vinacea]|uniref:Uncharacterized protein n=1 Tax=Nocardia vinacea TaxID=96468 RepID=A0ABZ1YPD2_9NOCA|nr:hypothetical protein [Nocardia vinacea]